MLTRLGKLAALVLKFRRTAGTFSYGDHCLVGEDFDQCDFLSGKGCEQ